MVEYPRYKKMKIICILEGAALETVKTKKVGRCDINRMHRDSRC